MTATKARLVTLGHARVRFVGEPLTLDAAQRFVGTDVELPTLMGNEEATYRIGKVVQDEMTGDIVAWVTRPRHIGGHHVFILE